MTSEQRGGSPQPDPQLPQKDREPYLPRFSLTGIVALRLQERGIGSVHTNEFLSKFDDHLQKGATTDNLLGIGLVMVPGDEGDAHWLVSSEKGVVIDPATYWSISKTKAEELNSAAEIESPVREFNSGFGRLVGWETPTYNRLIEMLSAETLSSEEYNQEQLLDELEDDDKRKMHTVSGPNMDDYDKANFKTEFWGYITTEQLREELGSVDPNP